MNEKTVCEYPEKYTLVLGRKRLTLAFGRIICAKFEPRLAGTVKTSYLIHARLFTTPIEHHTLINVYSDRKSKVRERANEKEIS